jgi:iron complex outermembrane receptor protein
VKDLIAQVIDPADGMLVFRNMDKAELKGVELQLDGKWDNGLRGRISTPSGRKGRGHGERLPNSRPALAKLNLLFPGAGKGVSRAEEQYTSAKRTSRGRKPATFSSRTYPLHPQSAENLELWEAYTTFQYRLLRPVAEN